MIFFFILFESTENIYRPCCSTFCVLGSSHFLQASAYQFPGFGLLITYVVFFPSESNSTVCIGSLVAGSTKPFGKLYPSGFTAGQEPCLILIITSCGLQRPVKKQTDFNGCSVPSHGLNYRFYLTKCVGCKFVERIYILVIFLRLIVRKLKILCSIHD